VTRDHAVVERHRVLAGRFDVLRRDRDALERVRPLDAHLRRGVVPRADAGALAFGADHAAIAVQLDPVGPARDQR
jgi:hypothetical protein